jgi:hypothetical protein
MAGKISMGARRKVMIPDEVRLAEYRPLDVVIRDRADFCRFATKTGSEDALPRALTRRLAKEILDQEFFAANRPSMVTEDRREQRPHGVIFAPPIWRPSLQPWRDQIGAPGTMSEQEHVAGRGKPGKILAQPCCSRLRVAFSDWYYSR